MAGRTQRVIIPKGLVNPNETTIVEIPANYKNVGTVVAKQKIPQHLLDYSYPSSVHSPPSSPEAPPPQRKITKRNYFRKTVPRPSARGAADSFAKGFTFAGRDWDPDESAPQFQPHIPKSPPASPDITYGGFMPHVQSTMGDLDYEEGSLYRDFRPKHHGTHKGRAGSPGTKPPSMERFSSTPKITRKTSITRTTPSEISQEEFTEESYDDYGESGSPMSSSGPAAGYTSSSGAAAGYTSSSPGYVGYSSGGGTQSSSGGGFQRFSSPEPSSVGGGQRGGTPLTHDQLMSSLGQLESTEMNKIMGDLSDYQSARRKLLFDTSSLATAADVSGNILSHTV